MWAAGNRDSFFAQAQGWFNNKLTGYCLPIRGKAFWILVDLRRKWIDSSLLSRKTGFAHIVCLAPKPCHVVHNQVVRR